MTCRGAGSPDYRVSARLATLVTKRPRPESNSTVVLILGVSGCESLFAVLASIESMQFRVNYIEVLFDVEPGHPVLLCHQTRLRLFGSRRRSELCQCTVESMWKDGIPEYGGFQPFAFAMSLIWTQAARLSTGVSWRKTLSFSILA